MLCWNPSGTLGFLGLEPPHLLTWPSNKPFSAPNSDISVCLASQCLWAQRTYVNRIWASWVMVKEDESQLTDVINRGPVTSCHFNILRVKGGYLDLKDGLFFKQQGKKSLTYFPTPLSVKLSSTFSVNKMAAQPPASLVALLSLASSFSHFPQTGLKTLSFPQTWVQPMPDKPVPTLLTLRSGMFLAMSAAKDVTVIGNHSPPRWAGEPGGKSGRRANQELPG